MRCVCSILLIFVVTPVLSDDVVPQNNAVSSVEQRLRDVAIEAYIEDLASPSFERRRNAFLELWKAGDEILPAIERATATDRQLPEHDRQRFESLGTLRLLQQLGISPGQQSNSLHLIELLNDVSPPKIVEMCELQYWDLAAQLIRNNSVLHETLSDAYGRYALNQIVDVAFEQGDLSKAWPIVRDTIPTNQAAWISQKLGLELPSQTNESHDNRALTLFYSGDVDGALACVQGPLIRANIVTRGFRWQEFAKEEVRLSVVGDNPNVAQSAAKAILLEIGGDLEAAEALWSRTLTPPNKPKADAPKLEGLREEQSQVAFQYLQQLADPIDGNLAQLHQLTLALLLAGRVEPVERFLADTNKAFAFSFYNQVNRFDKALEQVGLRADLSNFEPWLEEQISSMSQNLRLPGRNLNELLPRTALILLGLGHEDKAAQILRALANIAESEQIVEVEIWKDHIARWFSRHESRELCLRVAIENHATMSTECSDKVVESLYSELGSVAVALFATAPDHVAHPTDSAWEKLERLRLWDRDYFDPDCEIYISNWLREAKLHLMRENLSSDQLSQLGQVAHDFGFDELALELLATDLRELYGSETPNLHWLDAAAIYNEQRKPQEALSLLSSLRNYGFNLQSTYISEADTLVMAGEYDRASLLDRSRWLRPLAMENYGASYLNVARDYSDREEYERAAEYAEPAFLFSEPNSRFAYGAVLEYAEVAKSQQDYLTHANVQRALLVEGIQPYSELLHIMMVNGFLGSMRMLAHNERLSRAIVCIEAQDYTLARRHLDVAHQLQPQDIEVVVECFPRLIKAGQREFAEELRERYESELRAQIAAWPQDSTALNNLAWMFSQCNYRLEEALELAKQGVALAPSSPVFLDTLAEVEYRLGQVENALDSMRACVRLDPRDTHYRENLVRFRNRKD
jgi:hypothetical protein